MLHYLVKYMANRLFLRHTVFVDIQSVLYCPRNEQILLMILNKVQY